MAEGEIDLIDLGTINSEEHSKTAQLFTQPMPMSDSNETILMDLFGLTRTITVQGTYTGTKSELRSFISNIEGIHDGEQNGSRFTSKITGDTYDVAIEEFSYSWSQGETQSLSYTLRLKEGDVI